MLFRSDHIRPPREDRFDETRHVGALILIVGVRVDDDVGAHGERLAQSRVERAREPAARGIFRITPRGAEVLRTHQGPIDLRLLKQQPGYAEARDRTKDDDSVPQGAPEPDRRTPEERMEQSFEALRESLGREILAKLKAASPSFFERLVVELLVRMGYGGTRKDAGAALGKSGGEGIDGIIKEDRLGLDAIYIQAKRYQEQSVGRPLVQSFYGAMGSHGATKGVFLTTSSFSREATDCAAEYKDKKIVLIDGNRLTRLMIDAGVGVSVQTTYKVHRLDEDFFAAFEEE